MPTEQRRLATIVSLDIAGYSARTERDESRSIADVAGLHEVVNQVAARHAGRVFNTAGDGFMLEFGSSLGAVEAAFELAEHCEPKVRVGVHLGDVAVQPNGDLLGHGVNVAARLMAQADPGSALISVAVRQTLRGPIAERLVSRGPLKLDKMNETIEVFALISVTTTTPTIGPQPEALLAVLPFDNLSTDPDMQFFSDGVSEEILQRLARGTNLRVIGRTSSFQFRGSDKSVSKVANELHATHILDGSIRRASSRIRVVAQLVDAGTQQTLWTERYDRTLEDVFAVQDEIAEAIATALRQTLTGASTPLDPETYDLFLRANMPRFTHEQTLNAVALLEDVTRRAPNFANGWSNLAMARAETCFYMLPAQRPPVAAQVEREVRRALELDPDNLPAVGAQLMLLPPFGRFFEMEDLVERFKQKHPGASVAAGFHFLSVGRVKEAISAYRPEYEIDPLNPTVLLNSGLALVMGGHYVEARTRLSGLLEREPDTHQATINLLMLGAHTRDWALVDQLLAPERLATYPLRQFARFAPRYVSMWRDPSPETRQWPIQLLRREMAATGHVNLMWLVLAGVFGHSEEAYDIAAVAKFGPTGGPHDEVGPDAYTTRVLFYKDYAPFRRDPRFVQLCSRLGLVDYWLKTQKWPDCLDEVAPHYDFKSECEGVAAGPHRPLGG